MPAESSRPVIRQIGVVKSLRRDADFLGGSSEIIVWGGHRVQHYTQNLAGCKSANFYLTACPNMAILPGGLGQRQTFSRELAAHQAGRRGGERVQTPPLPTVGPSQTNIMPKTTLEPCPNPKCRTNKVVASNDYINYYVYCSNCFLRGPRESADRFGARWNSLPRISASPAAPVVEKCGVCDEYSHAHHALYKLCNNCWRVMPWREDGRVFEHKPYPYVCAVDNEIIVSPAAASPASTQEELKDIHACDKCDLCEDHH